jgi:hypothetical protein
MRHKATVYCVQPYPRCCKHNQLALFILYILLIALFCTVGDPLPNSLFKHDFFIPNPSFTLLHHEKQKLLYLAKCDKRRAFQNFIHGENLKHILQLRETHRLRAGQCGVRIPVGARDFSIFQNFRTDSGAHTASCSTGTGVLSLG